MSARKSATTITIDNARNDQLTVNGNHGRSRRRSRSRSSSASRNRRDVESARRDATPLLPEGALPRPKPPQNGPEIDEDEFEGEDVAPSFNHGIDDGFYDERIAPDDKIPIPEIPKSNGQPHPPPKNEPNPPFPFGPPDYGGPGEIPENNPRAIPDINVYQHKKTLAQGMMDLALLSANANQLRYVLESYERHPYYYFSVTFILASLILQVLVGCGLVFNSRYNIKHKDDICKADRINNLITVAILLITIINVFISAFGVAEKKV